MPSFLRGLQFERQRPFPVVYKGARLDCGYRLDIVLRDLLLVEIKAVEHLLPVHQAQVLTYLKLTQLPTALLVNFNAVTLKTGLRRLTRKQDLTFPSFPSPVHHKTWLHRWFWNRL